MSTASTASEPVLQPGQQKAPSSLRCVAARISSGPFLPTSSDSSPQGCPRCSASVSASGSLASRGWSRSARSPHRIPLRSVFRVFPPVPLVPTDLRRRARASRPFLPGTGPVFTGPRNIPTRRTRLQAEFRAFSRGYRPRGGRRVAIERVRTHGRRRARRDPRRAREGARERRGDGRGLAHAARSSRASRRAARCSVSTKECRSPSAGRSATTVSRPIASRSSRGRCRDAPATSTTSPRRCA